MKETDIRQGTLALMALKTLEILGPLHGYAIARRIEQISGDLLAVNQGTLYPVLLKLMQEGSIESEWGASENNRKARFYRLTRQGFPGPPPPETKLRFKPKSKNTSPCRPQTICEPASPQRKRDVRHCLNSATWKR